MTDQRVWEAEASDRLAQDLAVAGVRPGGVLLVHSSLRSLGQVPGGPETVIRGLLQVLGQEGTLLLPALSYNHVTRAQPVFQVRHTPSNVGAIPEFFRTRAGTQRSVHPTHSVCGIGPLAGELLGSHLLDSTPCGPNSPFCRLAEAGGQILMLGCGLRPNTSMHALEELVEPPYLFGADVRYRLVLPDGTVTEKSYRTHGFAGYGQRYDRVAEILNGNDLRVGRALAATVHLLEARPLWHAAAFALRQDPLHFVDRVP